MNILSLSETKDPKEDVRNVLKKEAKTIYECCNSPEKIGHSFAELDEHVKYVNIANIEEAKTVWKKRNKEKKK